MARELGLSPKRFGKYADRENQPWKLPLTDFIDAQYLKQFGKERPDEVKRMEEIAAEHVAKRAERKVANAQTAKEAENITSMPPQNTNDQSTAATADESTTADESAAADESTAANIAQTSETMGSGDNTTPPTHEVPPSSEAQSTNSTSEQQAASPPKPEQQS